MSQFPNREYVILESSEIDNVNFNEVIETSVNFLRYSKERDYFLLKFEDETPSFLESKTKYTYHEIKEIVNDTDGIWYIEPEED